MGYNFAAISCKALTNRSLARVLANNSKSEKPDLRFFQFLKKNDPRTRLGVTSQDGRVFVELSGGSCVTNTMLGFLKQCYSMYELKEKIKCFVVQEMTDSIKLIPPINPGKIICVGLNYHDHCLEQNIEVPKEPIFFSKLTSSVIGPKDHVVVNKLARRLDYEVELAVIIGRIARNVPLYRAMDFIFGYSVGQDITARDWQKPNRNGGQWLVGKSLDTFFPFGPTIVHKSLLPNIYDLKMISCVNGVQKQYGNTCNMIFKIDELVHRLSHMITLMPGDVILTGTPAGVGAFRKPPEYLSPGDVVESHISNIGTLRNCIVCP